MARSAEWVAQVLAARPDACVMCCDSPNLGLVVPTMALGGHGTANMTGNVAPAEMATLSTPWRSHADAEAFRQTYLRLLPLLHYTYRDISDHARRMDRYSTLAARKMKAEGLTVAALRDRGLDVVCALFLGGAEKIRTATPPDLGVPLEPAGDDPYTALAVAIGRVSPLPGRR